MRTRAILTTIALSAVGAITLFAQQQPKDMARTPGVQAGADMNRAAFIMANCKNPAPAPPARGGGCHRAPQVLQVPLPAVVAGAAAPPPPPDYNVDDDGHSWRHRGGTEMARAVERHRQQR